MEPEAGSKNGYIIHYKNSGLDYKGKSYFVFRDGIGYIVTFMATPGTYDINVPAFELFYKNISYL